MAKTISPIWKKIIFYTAIVFLILFLSWLLSSCNVAKREAKRDVVAVNRVKADINLLVQAGESYRTLFPCSNDSIIKTIHDTTTNTLTKTVKHTDTVVKNGIQYIFHTDTAFFEKTKTVYQNTIVTDHELENRRKDTINSLRLQLATQNGTIGEIRTNLSDANKGANKWHLYFWLLFAGAIVSHVVRSYASGLFSGIFKAIKK